MKNALALCACALFAAVGIAAGSVHAGARILVVTPRGEQAELIEAGLRAGAATLPDAFVADATEGAALMGDAKSTGLDCNVDEGACWLRVAVLGGLDHAVYAHADTVTLMSAAGPLSTTVLQPDASASWAAALRRTAGLESALRLTASPPSASVAVDGVPVVGSRVVEGVIPGVHAVAASAPGFVGAATSVSVPPGAVTVVDLVLVAEAPPPATISPLFIAGGALAGVGGAALLAGVGVGVYGEIAGGAVCNNEKPDPACETGRVGWITAIIGGAVTAVGAVLLVYGS